MDKRLKAVIIIEILILIGLFFHIARTPRMWAVVILAIVFTVLANRLRVRIFRIISWVFWAISAMILFSAGWFWLAIIFPAIMAIVFWKNHPREVTNQYYQNNFKSEAAYAAEENIGKANGNDVIDLDDVTFKPSGNSLFIKKTTGNTKIIVPDDVAVVLDITTQSGVVRIFDEPSKINAGNIRYFSENLEFAEKRIRINVRVENGNVEVIRG